VVSGEKVWNSGTTEADRGLLVARTDPDQPKHRGLSYFFIEVHQPGIEIRPIRQMNGQAHFNATFFTDATVADADLIGGLNNGWAVALATLTNERTTYAGGGHHTGYRAMPGTRAGMLDLPVGRIVADQRDAPVQIDPFAAAPVHQLMRLARQYGRDGDPVIRQRLAHIYAVSEVSRFASLRVQASLRAGRTPGPESSVGYVSGVQLARLSRDLGLELLGPAGTLLGESAPHGGTVQMMALTAPCHGIMGGTEQIQKNIIGERILGLPKEPQVDRDVPFRELASN
jgi:alkylation response protein AidB-like acyl-CoA dehydrogenase